jgi:ABC-type branched-subunit amino acid transport system ATPase component
MVAVARARSGDVRVLDEPFEGLVQVRSWGNCSRPSSGCEMRIAIVIIDHHLDLVLVLSDATVALERGLWFIKDFKSLRDDLDLRRNVLWL